MVACRKCNAEQILTKEKKYFCPDCNQINKTTEKKIVETTGSFYITETTHRTHKTYTVNYKENHKLSMIWTFKNDLEKARKFAVKKTKIDKKIFR